MPDKDPLPQVDNFSELGATGLWRTGGFVIDDILPHIEADKPSRPTVTWLKTTRLLVRFCLPLSV